MTQVKARAESRHIIEPRNFIPRNTFIAMHLVYFAPAVIFGLYYFFHGDITVARLRSLLSSEHAVEEVEHEKEENQKSGIRSQKSEVRS
jgi:hypothetical protein